jgi:methionyl aminopeptidase
MAKVDAEKAMEVGAVLVEAIQMARGLVKPGNRLADVADAAEKFLKDKGYGIAFPMNISINEQAAHYTPSIGDGKSFSATDLVKIDFGAEKEGTLSDCAVTVDLSGKYASLVEAANEALDSAISVVKAGVTVNEIGRVIAKAIESRGFKPIMNLGGHGIGEHDLHAEPFIPNYDNKDDTKLEEGMMIAIEPFATTGKGMVVDSDVREIYGYVEGGSVRSADARLVLREVEAKYSKEPFAVRWLSGVMDSKFRLYAAIGELVRYGAIEPYPTLVEVSKGAVSQAEAQLIVEKEGCKVITKIDQR